MTIWSCSCSCSMSSSFYSDTTVECNCNCGNSWECSKTCPDKNTSNLGSMNSSGSLVSGNNKCLSSMTRHSIWTLYSCKMYSCSTWVSSDGTNIWIGSNSRNSPGSNMGHRATSRTGRIFDFFVVQGSMGQNLQQQNQRLLWCI